MNATFTLIVLLGLGRMGGPVVMSDYDTEEQCLFARDEAKRHWDETHEQGGRIKFEAECIRTVSLDQ